MKKIKSYSIDEKVIEAIERKAKKEKRSNSQIVELYLAKQLKVKL
jgi:hypothetical protein